MKKSWKTTQLIAIGGLATLDVIFALMGGTINTITGIPLAGGVINNLVENSFIVFCLLLIDRPGTGMLFRFILAVLELPLPVLGTPGFAPKIIVGLIAGLIADILYIAFRKKRIVSAFLIGGLTQIWIVYGIVLLGRLAYMPGVEKTSQVIMSPFLLTGAVVLGGVGGLLGYYIYQKVKTNAIIKRIKGE